jgi:hypothetical protein
MSPLYAYLVYNVSSALRTTSLAQLSSGRRKAKSGSAVATVTRRRPSAYVPLPNRTSNFTQQQL